MNTRVEYLYRDAANYKSFSEVVFTGQATKEQLRRLRSALISSEFFGAGQVGLPDLAPWKRGATVYDDEVDHGFHELAWPPTATTREPSEPVMSFEAFVRRMERRAEAEWSAASFRRRLN